MKIKEENDDVEKSNAYKSPCRTIKTIKKGDQRCKNK